MDSNDRENSRTYEMLIILKILVSMFVCTNKLSFL